MVYAIAADDVVNSCTYRGIDRCCEDAIEFLAGYEGGKGMLNQVKCEQENGCTIATAQPINSRLVKQKLICA